MKIKMLEPGILSPEEMQRQVEYAKSVCYTETVLSYSKIDTVYAPPSNFSQFSLYIPDILRKVSEAEKENVDAICIDCFTDMGLQEAKISSKIPVVGACESSLHLACLLADRFGWITPVDEGVPFHWRQAKSYGMADNVIAIKAINIPLTEIHENKKDSETKLIELAQGMIQEGAQLIIIGCNGTLPALGSGTSRRLSEKLGVPIIDPLATMIKMAELLVSLNLSQSNLAFPKTAQL
jgi:allantoin racemase